MIQKVNVNLEVEETINQEQALVVMCKQNLNICMLYLVFVIGDWHLVTQQPSYEGNSVWLQEVNSCCCIFSHPSPSLRRLLGSVQQQTWVQKCILSINFTFVVFCYTVLIMVGIHCVASRMVAHLDAQLGTLLKVVCYFNT